VPGPYLLRDAPGWKAYEERYLKGKLTEATHIAWATGGSMVPEGVMREYREKGRRLL